MSCIECEPEPQLKGSHYNEAAKIIKGTDTSAYHKYIRLAIDQYAFAGRLLNAANLAKDAAEKAEEDFDYELVNYGQV